MKKKKIILLLALSMMLALSSCGKDKTETPTGDPQPAETVADDTVAPEPAQDTTTEQKEQTDPASADTTTEAPEVKTKYLFAGEAESGYDFSDNLVRNNGTHFVQVNDTVIFRSYGEDALDSSAFFGEFMVNGRSEPDYDYEQDSLLLSYTPSTDVLKELCPDDGTGILYYADGWIWSDGMDAEFEDMQVYRIDPATGKRENLARGSLRYVSASGMGLVQSYGYDDDDNWIGGDT